MLIENARILKNDNVTGDFYALTLFSPRIASEARPGQFVMIETASGGEPFLKRPLGLNVIDKEQGIIRLLFHVLGRGTQLLSAAAPRESLSLLGPLGNGWRQDAPRRALLVAGGAGAAPLLPLALTLHQAGVDCQVLLGARTAEDLICVEDFAAVSTLSLSTDDGSRGAHGPVTMLLPPLPTVYDMVYCCGPKPLMAKTARWAEQHDLPCQVSLEERMGCGYGVCMGCVCSIKQPEGETAYKRVCCDGPVFDSREVAW